MNIRLLLPVATLTIAACGPRNFPTVPEPVPAPAAPAPAMKEPPLDWHLRDATADNVPGISLLKAEKELLVGKQPKRTVVVAIIDSGVDTAHAELHAQLWTNGAETPGNGRDDDNNGFVDDVRGWSFIGGPKGDVNQDTFEVTRLAAQCGRPAGRDSLPADIKTRCIEIERKFQTKRGEVDQTLSTIRDIEIVYRQITPMLKLATGKDSLTLAAVEALAPANDTDREARRLYLQLHAQGISPQELADARKAYTSQAEYGYNKSFDPRAIVGDDYPGTKIMKYGNTSVIGPDATHGTHVAGIVAAIRDAVGATGIAQSVKIMTLRAVPDGDERDKDIANAIRYAADNGAHIINMSFGKAWSPYKHLVDDAVKYADAKGVLMVHAAGNDGEDVTKAASYPTPFYKDGGRAVNWIEVGATSWKMRDSLVAGFSNYGKGMVDLFAPGDDIYSSIPGGKFKKESGTSMASPVVAGVSALLMSYFPTLTASDVKRIVLESSTKLGDQPVIRPGEGGTKVKFGELSTTGGIVNVYNAIKMAEQMTVVRP
jgi:subtilisin family serine protease